MKVKTVFCSVIVSLLASVGYAQGANSGPYTEITEERWLPKYSILSIFQDRQGYFWIGTNSGLFKFNGLEAINYAFTQNEKNTLLNNTIHDIAEDPFGNIYVATGSGLAVIQTNPYKTELVLGDAVRNVETTPDGDIWATTINSGNFLYNINPADRKKIPYLDPLDPVVKKIGNGIRCLHQAADGNVWLGSANGVFFLDTREKKLYPTNFAVPVNHISADNNGVLWVGTASEGLIAARAEISKYGVRLATLRRYNLGKPQEASYNKVNVLAPLDDNKLIAGTYNHLYLTDLDEYPQNEFRQLEKTLEVLTDNNVLSALVDREQNIWVGTLHGLYKLKNQEYVFNRIKLATSDYIPLNNKVSRISRDREDNLWILSENDGLFRYDPKTRMVSRIAVGIPGKVKSLEQGSDGNFIIHIKDQLYTFSGSVVSEIRKEDLKPLPVTRHDVQVMLEVSKGNWWIGTWNDGLLNVSADGSTNHDPFFERVAAINKGLAHISCMVKDGKGNIWIGHRGQGIIKANRSENTIQVYHSGSKGLKSDRILSIYPDQHGRVWIATRGHGVQLYDEARDVFESFEKEDGLPSNTVCAFGEDADGDLWVSTQNGLAKFLPGEPVAFQHYGVSDGVVHPEFSFNAAVNDRAGTLYFANADGIYFIGRNKVNLPDSRKQKLVFVDFEILNTKETLLDSLQHALTGTVQRGGVIRLPYKNNSFSISFSSLDLTSPEKIKYAYRLKGYDDSWTYVHATRRAIQYLDVPPGHYTFEVRSSDTRGSWYDETIALRLDINPPFWLTPTAYVAYGILLFLAVALALSFLYRWFALKRQLKKEAAALRLHAQQMVYFADLSHEIKNRLTLILGPLETVLKGKKVNKAILQNLYEQTLLLKRINEQIINIRKSETGEFLLNVKEGDIAQYVAGICESVRPLALIRDITLHNDFKLENNTIWFDKELLEIIFLNLLTNAIKYTAPGGKVNVRLSSVVFDAPEVQNEKGGNYIQCIVEDTGIGIPRDEFKKVIEPFYRANNGLENHEGTGLGLNIVQRLIGRHYGWMNISSEENKFTKVIFYLPAERGHYALSELQPSLAHIPIVEACDPPEPIGVDAGQIPAFAEKKARILVVDDETDVRAYIADCLSGDFDIVEAADGESAYQQLLNDNEVSLVLSDLAMPLLDGVSLLKKIRKSRKFNDIPVIILTGRSSDREKLLCLQNNVDDFIEKPFSPVLLSYRIKNLLATRNLLKDKFIRKISVSQQGDLNVLSPDEEFIQKVVVLIENNLSNCDLNVEFLAEHMCISRATLYRRMEDLLNESPSEFIRKARLKKAAALLQNEGKFQVSQIAYMVGARTPKQFTRSFQKEYGITPTDYMKQENAASAFAES